MTRGLEGRRSIQLSYGGWAVPIVADASSTTHLGRATAGPVNGSGCGSCEEESVGEATVQHGLGVPGQVEADA